MLNRRSLVVVISIWLFDESIACAGFDEGYANFCADLTKLDDFFLS
jgi:hypothetical protein